MASGEASDLESNGTKPKVTKPDKLKQKIEPNHHRMYRSPVRPFFCCGSQISLNSITEIKDSSPGDKTDKENDDDYEDIATDSDDLLEEPSNLAVQQSPKKYDRTSPRLNRTSLTWKRKKTASRQEKSTARKKFWSLKLKGKLQVSKGSHYASSTEIRSPSNDGDICVCTSFVSKGHVGNSTSSLQGAEGGLESHIDDEFELYSSQPQASTSRDDIEGCSNLDRARGKGAAKNRKKDAPLPFINLNKLYPINDIDEQLIAQRRHEMEHGIEVEDVWILKTVNGDTGLKHGGSVTSIVCSTNIKKPVGQYPSYGAMALLSTEAGMDPSDVMAQHNRDSMEEGLSCSMLNLNMNPWVQNVPNNTKSNVQCHTQVDYIHFLVPDLDKIVRSSFYWGVMDRYQAEKLIENKAEGTFLLRDSAQDEFLFSVSFRRYGRSLHARIEQWNHKFSFDSRDPGVYATDTVCGLIDHYKDPSCCMFFEPMLTLPLNRTFPFSLQHLARAEICSRITYDGISKLTLPRSLKEYLQFYHYKQKIRVRRFDNVA